MFRYQLAERLGMSVARLDREMSSGEFATWMAFNGRRPLEEDDYRIARLCQQISRIIAMFTNGQVQPLEDFFPARHRKPSGFTGLGMKHAFLASHAHLQPMETTP